VRALVLVLAACGGVTADPGYGSELSIPGAQVRPGAFPASTGGPQVDQLVTAHASVGIGHIHERVHANMDGTATGAIVGIAGAEGTFVLTAGPPDIEAPTEATATAIFGLDPATRPGPFTLEVAATDLAGKIGDAATIDLVADAAPPPDGDLVVGLVWDSTADLDLHVVDPLGDEAWSGDPNTWKPPPPGMQADPNAYLTGGWLDHDANASCHIDGDPSEFVVWTTRTGIDPGTNQPIPIAPVIPPGTYTVRVDTRSLCRDASASWYVEVFAGGVLLGAARGVSTSEDAITGTHRAGSGVTALTFTR